MREMKQLVIYLIDVSVGRPHVRNDVGAWRDKACDLGFERLTCAIVNFNCEHFRAASLTSAEHPFSYPRGSIRVWLIMKEPRREEMVIDQQYCYIQLQMYNETSALRNLSYRQTA